MKKETQTVSFHLHTYMNIYISYSIDKQAEPTGGSFFSSGDVFLKIPRDSPLLHDDRHPLTGHLSNSKLYTSSGLGGFGCRSSTDRVNFVERD